MKRLAPLLVLTAAVLWGANGLFVVPLQDAGLSGTQITCARFISAATGAFAICAAKRCSLRIGSLRDATWFALNGVAGVFLFGLFYTYAIQATGMATAAVLIYLMPSFVMAFSVFTRREPCAARKVLCLAMSLLGCALVSGVAAPGASVAPVGVLFGVLAALFYACNNIVQAGPLARYEPATVSAWSTLFGALAATVHAGFCGELPSMAALFAARPDALGVNVVYGLVCSLVTFLLYNTALRYLPVSQAAILATFEPVAAAVLGFVVLGQGVTPAMLVGMSFEVAALVVLQLPSRAGSKGVRRCSSPIL